MSAALSTASTPFLPVPRRWSGTADLLREARLNGLIAVVLHGGAWWRRRPRSVVGCDPQCVADPRSSSTASAAMRHHEDTGPRCRACRLAGGPRRNQAASHPKRRLVSQCAFRPVRGGTLILQPRASNHARSARLICSLSPMLMPILAEHPRSVRRNDRPASHGPAPYAPTSHRSSFRCLHFTGRKTSQ